MADYRKEFSANQAGQPVGWVYTEPHEDEQGASGGVAVATIKSRDAYFEQAELDGQLGWPTDHGLGEKVAISYNVRGGSDGDDARPGVIVELRLMQTQEEPWRADWAKSGKNGEDCFAFGLDKHPGWEVGEWYTGAEGIVNGIREGLANASAEWFYSTLYHCLALASAEHALVPDTNMAHETREKIKSMTSYAAGLHYLHERDTETKKSLTVFGDTTQASVKGVWSDSRDQLGRELAHLQRAASGTPIQVLLGRPPFIEVINPERAESALADGNIEPAWNLLNDELARIEKRQLVVGQMLSKMRLLSKAEQAK